MVFFTGLIAVDQSPGGVSGTIHWYKAEGVLTSGSSITQINDLSGNNFHAVQTDDTEQPQIVNNGINGNQVIRFDGNSDHLPIKDKFYTNAGQITALNTFVVYKSSYSGNRNNNWSFVDYDRSDFYNIYVRGDGKIGFSYKPNGGATVDRTSITNNHNQGVSRLASISFDAGAINDTKIGVNGNIELDENVVATNIGIGNSVTRYGFIGDGSEATGFDGGRNNKFYDGDIAEIVIYENNPLSPLSINKVETYLAIKYGLHIDHNFISSSSDTIWNKKVNGVYHNLVTGIARDNMSGLNQTTSVNQESGKVTVESVSTLNNNDYLIWEHNNVPMVYNTSGVPAGYAYLLERVWKTELNNSIPNINVSINLSDLGLPPGYGVEDISLVVNSGEDFTTSSSFVEASSFDGTTVVFNNVSFIDGGYFTVTFKKLIVSDVFSQATFWLKADKDVYANTGATDVAEDGDGVLRWLDQTTNNNNALNVTGQPTYDNSDFTLNFLPVIDFSASNHAFRIINSNAINLSTYNKKTLFCSFRSGSNVTTNQVIYEEGGATNGLNVYISNSRLYVGVCVEGGSDPWEYFLSEPIDLNKEYIVGLVYNGNSTNTCSIQMYLNGKLLDSQPSGVGLFLPHSGGIGVGGHYNSSKFHSGDVSSTRGNYFRGQLQEIIYFNEKATDTYESSVISTYLALRSGAKLNSDYLDAEYQSVWSSTSNLYHNGVFGVGRDDNSTLDQRRGKSEDDNEFVDIRHLPNFFSDKSYAIVGHDNGTIGWEPSGVHSSIYELIGRTWTVKLSGASFSEFNISIDTTLIETHALSLSQYVVMVSDEDNFPIGTSFYPLTFDEGNYHLTGDITLSNSQFFTIAVVQNITAQDGMFSLNSTWLADHLPKKGEGFIVDDSHELTLNQNVVASNIILKENAKLNIEDNVSEITKGTITKGTSTAIDAGTSTVIYSNDGDQDVVGIKYYNLLIENSGTKTVIEPSRVQNNLGLGSVSTILNANNNITLESSASNTARVLPIPDGASLKGNIHVQRWVGATARKWWHMGSPVQNATIEEWHDDIPVTGDFATSDDVGGSNFASIKWYDETDPSTDNSDGWKDAPVNGFDEAIEVGRGYRVYIRQSSTDALNDTVISVTGVVNQGGGRFRCDLQWCRWF